jgi:hypothetical protein
MKFDTIRKQFYIEKSDITSNTIINEEDMRAEYGDNFERGIVRASQKVYDFIDEAYRMIDGYQHSLAIRYQIYKSKFKQTILKDAMIYYVEKDIELGVGVKDELPHAIAKKLETILRRGNLYVRGEINIRIEDLEKDWGDMA